MRERGRTQLGRALLSLSRDSKVPLFVRILLVPLRKWKSDGLEWKSWDPRATESRVGEEKKVSLSEVNFRHMSTP